MLRTKIRPRAVSRRVASPFSISPPSRVVTPSGVAAVGLLTLLASTPRAQRAPQLAPGFESELTLVERNSPYGVGGFAVGLADDLFFAVDHQVLHRDAAGVVTPIRSFQPGTRPGLLVRPAGTDRLYYTDPATTTVYVRDLRTGVESTQAAPAWAFDLDETSSGRLLFSANPAWPQPGAQTGLWTTDAGGGSREVVQLSGPSGPLLIDRATDDVYYATQSSSFPNPPGSVSLLRFAGSDVRRALAGGAPLQESDAQLVLRGLDGAYDLARDDRGRIYVSDPQRGGIQRLSASGQLDPVPLAAPDGTATLGLSFVDGTAATFDPWQPADGARLVVGIADWATYAGLREVRTARPRLTLTPAGSVPPGPFTQSVAGLPAGSTAFLLVNDRQPLGASRVLLDHLGIPVWSALDLAVPPISAPLAVDPAGAARLTLQWPGGFAWRWTAQVVALEPGPGGRLVTSPVLSRPLLP